MKPGRSLGELAAELERQAESKKDYIADTRKLSMRPATTGEAPDGVYLDGVNGGMTMKPIAHGQLANTLGIPKAYYDRMLTEAPDLLSRNVNNWLHNGPSKKLIRCLDGQVRAILSDSYRPMDNFELAMAVLPKLKELRAEVKSCEVTDNRLYLKAITDRVQGEVKKGDIVQAGVSISNSEVGQGSLRVEALDYRLVCLNGMISEVAVRKAHLGRTKAYDAIEDARDYFRSETRALEDKTLWMQVQDATGAMFNQDRLNVRLDKYRAAGEKQFASRPVEDVVEVTATRYGFSVEEKSGVLQNLIKGGDLSAWGLANAITRTAQDVESYDRATELEGLGGRVVELSQKEWDSLTKVS